MKIKITKNHGLTTVRMYSVYYLYLDSTSPEKALNKKGITVLCRESVTLCNHHETQDENYNGKLKINLLYC